MTVRVVRRAIGCGVVLGGCVATTAIGASAETVEIHGDRFVPERIRVDLGSAVRWANEDDVRHRIASDPVGFFRTSRIRPGTTSERVPFRSAGSFVYTSETRPRLRRQVGVGIRPGRNATPTPGAVIRIRVAIERAGGLIYDVQPRRDDGPWRTIREDASRDVVRFRPHHVGTFSFRARVTDTAQSVSSRWSPPRHKDVAPAP